MTKRKLAVCIMICALLLTAALPALAASAAYSGTCGDGLKWTLNDSGVLTISGSGKMIDFDNDAAIYTPWDALSVKKVVIKDGVTSIGTQAFLGLGELTSVTIGSGVKTIGDFAFQGCNGLTSLTIPKTVNTIGVASFSFCSGLTSLTIENGVKNIEGHAFWHCTGLKSVTVPNSVTTLDGYAFMECSALTSAKIGSGVTNLGDYIFADCNKLTTLTVGIKNIRNGGFSGLKTLTSLTLASTVRSIGDLAFWGCSNLKTATIPKSVTIFGEEVFLDCENLTVSCYAGSAAQDYASANSIYMKVLKEKPAIITQPRSAKVNEGSKATFKVVATGADSYKWYSRKSSSDPWAAVSSNGAAATLSFTAKAGHDGRQYRCLVKNSGGSAYSSTVTLTVIPLKTYTVKYNANGGTGTPSQQTKKENVSLTLSSIKPTKKYVIQYNANGGSVSPASKTVKCTFVNWNTKSDGSGTAYAPGDTYFRNARATLYAQWKNPVAGTLAKPTRTGYTFAGWYTAASGGRKIAKTTAISDNMTVYAHWKAASTGYTMGVDSYSFGNYRDADSFGGHCFGMSMTSAGYYNNLLSISKIGGAPLYSRDYTDTVTKPICYYQGIQDLKFIQPATVAGGTYYLHFYYNIASDWKEVVDYVSDHSYDNKGLLQIGFRKTGAGGHAINFLRYEKVNGEDRIYAYDNNFPNQETYFYRDSSGHVLQAPVQTFSGAIDCITLRDCRIFFQLAGTFDKTHALYMAKDAATVEGYTYSVMDTGVSNEEYVMYYIPADQDHVRIIPSRDNADFIYMDKAYSLGKLTDDNSVGELKFATVKDGVVTGQPVFTMVPADAAKPVITAQPKSVTVNEDVKATFKVAAKDAESYQWYYRSSASEGWQKCDDSSTAASYSVIARLRYNGCQFRCLIKNSAGSTASKAVTLTVNPKPVIFAQPQSVTANEGEKATFSIVAEGADSYQWYVRKSQSGVWQKCSNAAADSFSFTAKAAHNRYQYRCLMKNSAGSVYTGIITLTVNPKPVITAQPKSVTVNEGEKAAFKVAAKDADSYQWYYRKSESGVWQKCSDAAAASLSFTAKAAHNGYQYRCLVKNSAGSVYSSAATLTVHPKPVITSQPQSATVDAGTKAAFKVVATGADSYQWYYRKSATGTWQKCSAAAAASFSVTAKAAHNGYQYRCLVKNSVGSVFTATATLTVK